MTPQEFVDNNVRLTLGDLMLQIILLKARVAELESAAAAVEPPPAEPVAKPNGKARDAAAVQ